MNAQVAIAGMAVLNLGLDDAAIDNGRHPPLAPAGT
jgi:hypothetical protein